MLLQYYLYYIYYTFIGFPFVIRVAVISILISAIFFFIAFFRLVSSGNGYRKKKQLKEKFSNQYLDKITQILSAKDNFSHKFIETMLNCDVKKMTDKEKRVMTNRILYILDKVENLNQSNYNKLLDYFDLRNFWEKKLKYGNMSSKQRALRKLDNLNIEIPASVISAFTYNRDPYLRKMARYYYMHFSKNNPYKFLDEDFDKTFNNWDRIELHRIFALREKEGLPNFTPWVKKSNNSLFKCFLIDEIKFFKQKESAPSLVEMLNCDDIQIKKHCIEALGELNYTEAEDLLCCNYALQPLVIQKSILGTIQKFSTGNALPFLRNAFENTHNDEMKILIVQVIYNYGNTGIHTFNSMKNNMDENFLKKIFDHVSNPLIKPYAYA